MIQEVRQSGVYLHRSLDTAGLKDLRRYQLHLVDQSISPVSLNATITGLPFFFELARERVDLTARIYMVHVQRTLPVILSRDEAARLVAAAPSPSIRLRYPSLWCWPARQ